jgi:RNA polymerase sigma-70 factor (ECF subfamily)
MTQGPNKPDITTREGFGLACAPLERLLLTVSYGVLHSWDLAADAVQSALLKGWRYRHSVKDPASFKPWLVRIAINESKNMMRRGFTVELDENTADEPVDREMRLDVRQAVYALPEKYRLPVILFYFEDMAVADIAKALDIPQGTVISHLHRGRARLREELKDYYE